jgi:ribosomal protein S18 acetylase RimI-like enzyme
MADRSDRAGDRRNGPQQVAERTVPPGSDERSGAVWALKERIRSRDGLLVQRGPFFDAQYRQSTCYLSVGRERGAGDEPGRADATDGTSTRPQPASGGVVGFALVRPDGYLSLIGVDPDHRRRGLGSRLLQRAIDDHAELSCHVRSINGDALGFYAEHGFLVAGRVEGYYRDGTDAYRLVRDPKRADRLADALE